MCCLAKGDYERLPHYAGVSVSMSRRLGLHQSQKSFPLGPLVKDMRKRVFWSLYTLDWYVLCHSTLTFTLTSHSFTAALLGLPRLMKETEPQTEIPADVDEENLSEAGVYAASGSTKISAALTLFRLTRTFARIIDEIYTPSTEERITLSTINSLAEELDAWRESLPAHLRLVFAQDKPSTRVTGDRSPLLSMVYYYLKSLLHRPALMSDLGDKAAPSIVSLADSSKHIVQIVELLEERHMSFALPLNREEILVQAGLGLLYRVLGTKQDRAIFQGDNQRLVCAVATILNKAGASSGPSFSLLACSLIRSDSVVRRSPSSISSSSRSSASSHEKRNITSASRPSPVSNYPSSDGSLSPSQAHGYAHQHSTEDVPKVKRHSPTQEHVSPTSVAAHRSDSDLFHPSYMPTPQNLQRRNLAVNSMQNLDYLPLGLDGSVSPNAGNATVPSTPMKPEKHGADWEYLLGYLTDSDPMANLDGHAGRNAYADMSPSDLLTGTFPFQGDWSTASTSDSMFDDSSVSLTPSIGRSCSERSASGSRMGGVSADLSPQAGFESYSHVPSMTDDFAGFEGFELGVATF